MQKKSRKFSGKWGCYLTRWTLCRHKYCLKRETEWLDIFYKGRMVEINGKGKIREKTKKNKNTGR